MKFWSGSGIIIRIGRILSRPWTGGRSSPGSELFPGFWSRPLTDGQILIDHLILRCLWVAWGEVSAAELELPLLREGERRARGNLFKDDFSKALRLHKLPTVTSKWQCEIHVRFLHTFPSQCNLFTYTLAPADQATKHYGTNPYHHL